MKKMKKMKKILLTILYIISISSYSQTTTSGGIDAGIQGVFNSNFGYNAGTISKGSNNNFIGSSSGVSNTTGARNVFNGASSGYNNTTGANNTFLGYSSGLKNVLGTQNTYVGYLSGKLSTGNYNTFLGANSGSDATGDHNIFIGLLSGSNNTGGGNVFIGNYTGKSNLKGSNNVFFGVNSGRRNTKGSANVFLGSYSGFSNLIGTNNTYLGYNSGRNSIGSNNVFIGLNAGSNEQDSNKLYIDNSNTTTPLIYGDFDTNVLSFNGNVGIGTASPDATLTVKGDIHTQEVKVDLQGALAPDYVFLKGYDLKTLEEVSKHIEKEGHLPNVPSAKEMEKNGVKLKMMTLKLLEKIEELTLYTIEQENKIKGLEKDKQRLSKLEEKVNLLLKNN